MRPGRPREVPLLGENDEIEPPQPAPRLVGAEHKGGIGDSKPKRPSMDQNALCAFTATSAFFFLKLLSNSFLQGYARFRGAGFRYPEDQVFGKSFDPDNRFAELEHRATCAWRNDLENIPLFLVAALCGLLNGIPAEPYTWLLGSYCVLRVLHTLFLIKGTQPGRFLSFVGSVTVMGVVFVWSLRLAGFN